ncbi:hypothetical protein ACQKP6_01405 [Pseudomonas fluorescens]|uniref:hypothetical protein n=1 Tax=Pseudomonas fluorescens TaxID=294 RepID=UPI003D06CA74
MSSVEGALKELINTASTEGLNSDKRDWSTGDLTSVGALMAGVGGIAQKIGLTNTGAGLAVAGLATSNRYQYPQQKKIYYEGMNIFGCIQRVVHTLPDSSQNWAIQKGPTPEFQAIAARAAYDTVEYVDAARLQLVMKLGEIQSTPVTKEQISDWAKRYNEATTLGASMLSKYSASSQAIIKIQDISLDSSILPKDRDVPISAVEQNQALEIVPKFKVELEACLKLVGGSG